MPPDFDYSTMSDREILIDIAGRVSYIEAEMTKGEGHFRELDGKYGKMDKRLTVVEKNNGIKASTVIKCMVGLTAMVGLLIGVIEAVKAWG